MVSYRLLWTATVTVICTFCLLLIRATYTKWQSSPVIVTFAEKETSISEIPFPAVTICPDVKIDPGIFNFTDVITRFFNNGELTEQEKENVQLAALVCEDYSMDRKNDWNTTVTQLAKSKLLAMYPAWDSIQEAVIQWLMTYLKGNDKIFIRSFTTEGICYTFNALPIPDIIRNPDIISQNSSRRAPKAQNWSIEKGYSRVGKRDYPRRTFMSGPKGGFALEKISVNDSQMDYFCSEEGLQGFKVALHHPSELPNMDKYFRLPLKHAMLVRVKPILITMSAALLNYSPNDRKCYFHDEKYLSLYKVYTQQNCFSECLINYTIAECKCIPFYIPVLTNYSICGPRMNYCVYGCSVGYIKKQGCDCLPSCTSLSYDIETSLTDWDRYKQIFPGDPLPKYAGRHFSKLQVYFNDPQFMSCERNELYGTLDFFSNIGGLLGLFIGFSVISAIEVLYFFTLRIICNIKKYGTTAWSGDSELLNRV